jgi:hypothetical protein
MQTLPKNKKNGANQQGARGGTTTARADVSDGADSERELVLMGKGGGRDDGNDGCAYRRYGSGGPQYGRLMGGRELLRSREISEELTGGKGNREIDHK